MSVEAVVETEYGERLLLWHTDGTRAVILLPHFLEFLMFIVLEAISLRMQGIGLPD